MTLTRVVLKPNRDKAVRAFHPWIFSGSIDLLDEGFKKGDLVRVLSSEEEFLGIGYLNPESQIAVRMLTSRDEEINLDYFERRFEAAKRLRLELLPAETNAYRWIHSEGDFLPGLIVDRYADFLVVQFLTAGMDALKVQIVSALEHVFCPKGIYEKDDPDARRREGLKVQDQQLSGSELPDQVEITEQGVRFLTDLKSGQKTGFFLDQRANRWWVHEHSKGKRVLDCFAYSGAFSVYAAKGGAASVTSVESQKRTSKMIERNFELNGFSGQQYKVVCGDVFDVLREGNDVYDLVILDPPAFCKTRGQVNQAARGYKDINLNAMRRTAPGGILCTFSCSHFVDSDLFQKIVFGAAKDAGREAQVLQRTSHPFDHPVSIYHPEGAYLKGLLLRVL